MNLRNWLILVITSVVIFGCKSKKKPSMSGEDPVTVEDFIESFAPVDLPYQFADSAVAKKAKDSLIISYKIFTQFIPDSALQPVFGKNSRLRIYPMGRVEEPKIGNYLFAKIIANDRKAAYVLSFDNKNRFVAAMPVLQNDANPATKQSFVMDKRFTLSKNIVRKNPDGSTSEGKDVYILNETAHAYFLIMTDALDAGGMDVVNPIDTMQRKNKLSGDYQRDTKNIVSIRDSKRPGRITFFIHFERNNGSCTGELKGEAIVTTATEASRNTEAVYRGNGDPCAIQFSFTPSSVSIKEIGGCGSHRDIDCVFEGNFARKKEVKPKKAASK